ncbi:magnesium transporter [Salinisphaera sp. Q1T1-3]|uniref:magnesium transporter n=1 Tax=Salinisphaera sp. Q1T1-3 TaxID=2321229 RepID=UPI000E7214FE|nr:magnesium transporter [Salinisphaera sp. Q1T1-3]RJS92255.1 magnesium transporter [Salinisphaera sp. Q1T1-3]
MSETDVDKDTLDTRLASLDEAFETGRTRRLKPMLAAMHPAETALLLESIPRDKRETVWRLIPDDDHGETLLHVNGEVRAELVDTLEHDTLLAATEGLAIDDLADLIEDLPDPVTRDMLRAMDADNRERLKAVLAYDPASAGGLMNNDTVTVRPDVSLAVVARFLRWQGRLPEDTETLFVISRQGRYIGLLPLSKLVTLDPERDVSEVMDTDIDALAVDMPAAQVAKRFQDLDLISAPVVNADGVLLGRITIDDVVDVIRDEAEHRIMSLAGLDEEEDVFAPIPRSARRRAIWLGANLMTAFVASQVVNLFEGALSQVVALAVLMPIVASMGGIGGTQTLTLMIRGLSLGQIGFGNARALLMKEIAVALINGLLWGAVVGGIAILWFDNATLGAVMAAALIINHLNAAVTGVAIPLAMKRMGIDPALAGSVVLTTFTDVIGFAAFLGLGTIFLTH